MLFSRKVAASLNARYWIPNCCNLSLFPTSHRPRPPFGTIRRSSPFFALFETICTIRTMRYSRPFTICDSQLFTICYSGTQADPIARQWFTRICLLIITTTTSWNLSIQKYASRTKPSLSKLSDFQQKTTGI